MKRNDPTFKEMVARMQSGELTRKQAADTYGVRENTLVVWLGRSGIEVPRAPKQGLHGDAVNWTKDDPVRSQALQEAFEEVLAGTLTARTAVIKYGDRGVAYTTIAQMVRNHLAAQGIKRPPGRPRGPLSPPHP